MELSIFNINSSFLGLVVLLTLLNEQLVIQSEFAFRHARKLRFHDNLSDAIGLQDSPFVRKKAVHIFNDVDEDFVFPVPQVLSSPRNSSSRLDCNGLQLLNIVDLGHLSLGDVHL